MANRKLSELTARVGASLNDIFIIADPTTGFSYKITGTDLKTLLGVISNIIAGNSTTTGSALQVRDSASTNLVNIQNNGLVAVGSQTPTSALDLKASTTTASSLRIRSGVAPTTPNAGDVWYDGTSLKTYLTTFGTGAFLTTAPRWISTTSTTSLAINIDAYDLIIVTAQTTAIALANPTGTKTDGQKFMVRITTTTGGGAITYGTDFRASTDMAFPTTTVTGKTIYLGFMWNNTSAKWDMIAKLENF